MCKAYIKTKPAGLLIHLNYSNITCVDAIAAELGLCSQTEQPQTPQMSSDSDSTKIEGAQSHSCETMYALLGATTQ
jgi:hypothetical protein